MLIWVIVENKTNAFNNYLKEIIYGGNDGVVTTFAVVAGFSGASLDKNETLSLTFLTVLLFGLANLFADALSMGLGNYLSIRAGRDIYKQKKVELNHLLENNHEEALEISKKILIEEGMSLKNIQNQLTIFEENIDYWSRWLLEHHYQIESNEGVKPLYTGLATFISFLVFGAIPLIPFVLIAGDVNLAFLFSSIGVVIALVLLGLLRWKVIGAQLIRSVLEILLIGGTAAIVAFIVGIVFAGL